MSSDLQDRTANRPAHLCSAYGCPLIGSMSTSTGGSDEWWCFAHFRLDYGDVQTATREVNRLSWLAAACRDCRDIAGLKPKSPEWHAAYALAENELTLNGRRDLLPTEGESRRQWLGRLEAALLEIVRESVKPPPLLPVGVGQNTTTFGKVGFDMPA